MDKAVFLDKDGTLVKDVPYNVAPEKMALEAGVAQGLKYLKERGYKLVVISNQPGVAKGYFEESRLYEMFHHLQRMAGVSFSGFYYCPHHPQGVVAAYSIDCNCRKPRSQLFFTAARELGIDLKQSWMIGDILNDVEAGNRAGCKTVLIDNGNETEWDLNPDRIPNYVASTFPEAVIAIKSAIDTESLSYEKNWEACKNILCIRPDNMGDLLMTTPAIRALKESFNCRITVLTSSMAAGIASFIPEIDDVIVFDVPWVKTSSTPEFECYKVIDKIRQYQFDGAIVFNVYSQNPVPSIMLAYLAEIPLRLSYCRENPYALLTDWLPDPEPYSFIQHQVRRDLNLVASIGATTDKEKLSLCFEHSLLPSLEEKLAQEGVAVDRPWLILHPGVSEEKRMYPKELWIEAAKMIRAATGFQLLFTGSASEASLAEMLVANSGADCFSLAGKLSLKEFMLLVQQAPVIVSVNTGTIHIAAATGTPVVVLYALTNPQHSPWKTPGQVLLFEVSRDIRSKNEVIRFVSEKLHPQEVPMVAPGEIVQAVKDILLGNASIIPEMIPLQNYGSRTFFGGLRNYACFGGSNID